MEVKLNKRLISVSDYYLMLEVGILTEHDQVELIRGEILNMSPKKTPHAACLNKFVAKISKVLPSHLHLRTQDPIRLGQYSEPEPDLVIVKHKEDFYLSHHPIPEDIHVIIEIADTTLTYDRNIKGPLYAEYKIPAYWIVNLPDQRIECYSNPQKEGYKKVEYISAGSIKFPPPIDIQLNVKDIFIKANK